MSMLTGMIPLRNFGWIRFGLRGVGFSPFELRLIESLVEANRDLLLRKWDEYFGN